MSGKCLVATVLEEFNTMGKIDFQVLMYTGGYWMAP